MSSDIGYIVPLNRKPASPGPMTGKTIVINGKATTVGNLDGKHYLFGADGDPNAFCALASDVEARIDFQNNPDRQVSSIIADYHAAMEDKRRSQATAIVIDMEALRLGLEPKALSEPERMVILARLNREARERDTSPLTDMQQTVAAIIAEMQGEKPKPYDPRAAVQASGATMGDDAKAHILARLDPKAAANKAAGDYQAMVRRNVIDIQDRIRRTGR